MLNQHSYNRDLSTFGWITPGTIRPIGMHPLLLRARASIRRNKFLRFGLPFLSFMVLGSFGLAEFTEIRVKKNDEKTHMLTAEETLQFQKKVKTVDVEEELDKTLKELDIDHWVNKRVPRPPGWEE